jgi:hypothetical protein
MLNARSRGPGGGGAIYAPEISPRSPDTIFLSTDRSGLYRTDDGGLSWNLQDERTVQGSNRFSVAFHPTVDKILAFHPRNGFVEGASDPDAPWTSILSLQAAKLTYPAVGMPMGNSCSTSKPGIQKVTARTTVKVTAAAYCPDEPGSFLIGTERGVARFDGQKMSWVFPVDSAANPTTFDDYSVPDAELGTGVANSAEVLRFVVFADPMQPGSWLYFVATSCDILQSYDRGRTWTSIAAGLPGRSLGLVQPGRPQDTASAGDAVYTPSRIRGFAGGGSNGSYALFATVSIVDDVTLSTGGVWAYDGYTWRRAMGGQINTFSLATDPSKPVPTIPASAMLYLPRYEQLGVSVSDQTVVYVACQNTGLAYPVVYRGAYDQASNAINWVPAYDGVAAHTQPAPQPRGGTSVRNVQPGWIERDLGWAFGGPAKGFAVAPTDAQTAIFTNRGAVHLTKNGGANAGSTPATGQAPPNDWASVYTLGSPETLPWWESTGIGGTTVWNYYAAPGQNEQYEEQYIAAADVGFGKSIDGGDTWHSQRPDCSSGSPPANCATNQAWSNFYELAFGAQSGQSAIWAAVADVRGIPIEVSLDSPPDGNGAVLLSLDDGDTWTALPNTGLLAGPVTSVVRSGSSVFVAVWFNKAANSGGVYRFDDGATSWVQVGGAAPGRLPYRLALDPTNAQGLYCLVLGDGAGTKSGIYSQIGTGAWTTEGQIEAFSPVDLIVNESLVTQQTELYLSTTWSTKTKNGDLWKSVKGIWQPLGAFAPTTDNPNVAAFSLTFVGDMVYATSLTHGTRCARRADVENFDGSKAIEWIDYPALNLDRLTRISGVTDLKTGRSRLLMGTVGGGANDVLRRIYFVFDKRTFSREDFNIRAGSASQYTYQNVMWIVFEGFLPKELGVKTVADLNANKPTLSIGTALGVSASAVGDALVEVSDSSGALPPAVGQRIAFPVSLSIDLSQGNPFPDPPKPGQPWQTNYLYVSARSIGGTYGCESQLEFVSQAEPFMSNGSVGWLSADTCVFKVLPGSKVAFGQDLADGKPLDFLKSVLTHLNDPTNTTSSTDFDSMRDGGPSTLELATTEGGVNAYNFALARIHYLADSDAASDVNVFFRIFSAAFTGFDYDTAGAYQLDSSGRVPLLGIKAGQAETGEVVSIPCFGSPRVAAGSDMSLQTDPLNFHQAIAAKAPADSLRYFGCWLDFNQQTPLFPLQPGAGPGPFPTTNLLSIQQLIRGRHQCLVVEINVPGEPIAAGSTPQSSDKLAQRNLVIVDSDNPGSLATHTVQHSFEISAPLPPPKYNARQVTNALGPEDDLVFEWGNLPRTSSATLFLPDVDVSEILSLADARGGPKRFHKIDGHTIGCTIGDVSYLPLPQDRTTSMVALLTIELPSTVTYRQSFSITVRQVEGRAVFEDDITELRHRVIGSFVWQIPVQKADALLEEEERKLAVLRYLRSGIPKRDPWAAVFDNYVGQVAARVDGFGGDSAAIPASPNGAPGDQPDRGSCLQAAFAQLQEGMRTGDAAMVLGAIRAGERCLECSFKK